MIQLWFHSYRYGEYCVKKISLVMSVLCFSTTMAFADTDLGDNGLYVGAAAGVGWNNVQSTGAAFRLDGGVNLSPNWGIEVGTTGLTQSGSNPNQSMQFYDLSVKGSWTVSDPFDLFIQVGGAYGSPGVVANNNPQSISTGSLLGGWYALTGIGAVYNITQRTSFGITDYYYYGGVNPQGQTDGLLAGFKFNF
jgi:hypothetical protein